MTIRAVCFDMDGVLTDTEPLGAQLMTRAAALQGFEAQDSQWVSLIGTTMVETGKALEAWFPGIDAAQFLTDWRQLTFDYVEENGVPLRPGAQECLTALRHRGIPLALCTSNDPDVVETYLRLAGWQDVFQTVVTARQVTHAKPAPDIYLEAARRLGVSPGECAGVEDSPTGIRAVRAAGMLAVMIPDQIPYSDALAEHVDMVLGGLDELLSRLPLAANH